MGRRYMARMTNDMTKILDRSNVVNRSPRLPIQEIRVRGQQTFVFFQTSERFRAYEVQRYSEISSRMSTTRSGYYDSWHETPESVMETET